VIVAVNLKRLLGWALVAAVIGSANAADPLPDRRAVRPGAPSAAPAAPQQGLAELLGEIESLQAQLRELRGQIEVQAHQLEQMKNRQLQSMVDVDRRLRELERRAPGQTSDGSNSTTIVTPPIGSGPPPIAAAPAPQATPTASEQQQYNAAFALMKQGLYEQAARSFREFVARNPKGALADNAQYWIGEAAYVTRDFRTALDEFGKVVSQYPQSTKVPDALLKIGYTQYELAAYSKARETLSQVVARYPNTTVARSAELRLEKMKKEGR